MPIEYGRFSIRSRTQFRISAYYLFILIFLNIKEFQKHVKQKFGFSSLSTG